jgi:CheY-like chemotaxis protein
MRRMLEVTMEVKTSAARGLCVLVVDDDPFILALMRDMLELAGLDRPGCVILTESDPGRGLERLTAARPDLLICDLSMPDMDGIELLAAAATKGFAGAVLLLSGMDLSVRKAAERLARAQGLHVVGAFGKPIELDDLRRALATLPAASTAP